MTSVISGLLDTTRLREPPQQAKPAPKPAPVKPAPKDEQEQWTYDALMAHEFPEIPMVVDSLLPVGLAILSGRPKEGKSRMSLQLAYSVASGGLFLGRQCQSGPVLYLALEDSPRRIQKRLREMRAVTSGMDITMHFNNAFLDRNCERLLTYITGSSPRLVIIDTLTRAFPRTDWDKVNAVTLLLGRLQQAALQHNTCLLFVDHRRKPGQQPEAASNPVDDTMGSTGKTAVADVILGIYRKPGEKTAKLLAIGRDVEEQAINIRWDNFTACWQVNASLQEEEGKRGIILRYLKDHGAHTNQDIAQALGMPKQTVSYNLQKMKAEGEVLETAGKYDAVVSNDAPLGQLDNGTVQSSNRPTVQSSNASKIEDPFEDDASFWDHVHLSEAAKALSGRGE